MKQTSQYDHGLRAGASRLVILPAAGILAVLLIPAGARPGAATGPSPRSGFAAWLAAASRAPGASRPPVWPFRIGRAARPDIGDFLPPPVSLVPGGNPATDLGGMKVSHPETVWRIQRTRNQTRPIGRLQAGSCARPGLCTAVGLSADGVGRQVPLAERERSGRWRVQRAASPPGAISGVLSGVSCASVRACVAAGGYHDGTGRLLPLAERWHRSHWKITAVPGPAGAVAAGLAAVSCSSARVCTAVGSYVNRARVIVTLAERWNGTRWRAETTPNPAGAAGGGLLGVSCSSARACTAVGSYADRHGTILSMAEQWNGRRWKLRAVPTPARAAGSELAGVSCVSARACMAAGRYEVRHGPVQTLAERWNGTRWRIEATPSRGTVGSALSSVSCSSAGSCMAAGYAQSGAGPVVTLAERWNGLRWKLRATPNPAGAAGGSGFFGVSCGPAAACTAVGTYFRRAGTPLVLAERARHGRWVLQRAPSPAGATFNQLSAVSCGSSSTCTAVGSYTARGGNSLALAERWDGTRWRLQRTPSVPGAASTVLNALSCPSATACTAVGESFIRNGDQPLAEAWDGTAWHTQPIAGPTGSSNTELFGVSCSSASACTAVGQYHRGGHTLALAQRWDGSTWQLQRVTGPAGTTDSSLFGVSCSSMRACTAVGGHKKGTFTNGLMLAERWDGTAWTAQDTPAPAGTQASGLSGVSCGSIHDCTAVGTYFNHDGLEVMLAERWDGTTWRPQHAPMPPGAGTSQIGGVSCASARVCTAVGDYAFNDFAPPIAFAEAWDGTRWTVQVIPTTAGTSASGLFGVSCTAPRACTAVGAYQATSGVAVTLAVTTR
jgi:hypothetical protein